jgi:hypothetical protein
MKTTLNEKAEKIKSSINGTAEKSKEAIRDIISSNSKHIGAALDSNSKFIDTIRQKLDQQEIEIDNTIIDTWKRTFGKSIELSEDAIDSIINAYTRQVEFSIDFNTKLIDAIKASSNQGSETVLQFIQESFETSRQLITNSLNEIIDSYNKHTNLALNFNQKFGEVLNVQLESLSKIQENNVKLFSNWTSEWWKTGRDKKEAVV